HWHKFDALTVVVACSPLFRGLQRVMRWKLIHSLGTRAYHWVANRRPQLSRGISFLKYRPNRTSNAVAVNIFSAVMLVYVFLWNVGDFSQRLRVPDRLRFVAFLLRTDQAWDMFSPYPLKDD